MIPIPETFSNYKYKYFKSRLPIRNIARVLTRDNGESSLKHLRVYLDLQF